MSSGQSGDRKEDAWKKPWVDPAKGGTGKSNNSKKPNHSSAAANTLLAIRSNSPAPQITAAPSRPLPTRPSTAASPASAWSQGPPQASTTLKKPANSSTTTSSPTSYQAEAVAIAASLSLSSTTAKQSSDTHKAGASQIIRSQAVNTHITKPTAAGGTKSTVTKLSDRDKPIIDFNTKPTVGDVGTAIKVRANMFALSTAERSGAKEPRCQEADDCSSLGPAAILSHQRQVATDWMTLLVSRIDLSTPNYTFRSQDGADFSIQWHNLAGVTSTVVLRVHEVRRISIAEITSYLNGSANINLMSHLTALNVPLRKVATDQPYVIKIGSDKFFPTAMGPAIGNGLEARSGFLSSAQAFHRMLAVNMKNVSTAFIMHGDLLNYVMQSLGVASIPTYLSPAGTASSDLPSCNCSCG
ncbi:hypothetical protein LTR95_017764 [Oleoguttula sp. CCFEE 5521]